MADGLFGVRVQAPQLRKVALQPAGVPNSPQVRPQVVDGGGNLAALTDALGGLSASLQSLAKMKDAVRDDPESKANKEWLARAQMMDRDQLIALANSGEAEGNRVREDAINALLGDRAYADFLPAMETYFSTEFDRTSGDPGQAYEEKRKEYAAALPNDIARANFYRLTEPHKARIVGGVTDERIATTKQQINTTIVDSWYQQITEAGKGGKLDPDAVASAIFDGSAANQTFFGLSGAEQDATIWALAQRLAADGKVDEAEALINAPRKGADGSVLPPLGTIPEFAVQGKSLIEAAKTERARQTNIGSAERRVEVFAKVDSGELTLEDIKAETGDGLLFSEQEAARLVAQSDENRETIKTKATMAEAAKRDEDAAMARAGELMSRPGGVNRIVDVEVRTPTGGTKTLTREERIGGVRRAKEVEWASAVDRMVANGMSEAEAKAAISDVRQGWYISNAVPNEEWSRSFSTLPQMVTPTALDKNPGLATKAAETAESYLNLRAKSPAYAETLVDSASREFLETYALAREIDGMTPEEAVAAAAGLTSMPKIDKALSEMKADDRDKIVRGVLSATREGTDGEQAEAGPATSALINEQVNRMAARGMPKEAIERSLKTWVSERTISVNGVLVPVQKGMDAEFPLLVDRHLQKVFADKAEVLKSYGIEGPEDLSIAPVAGETRWLVISKETGLPVGAVNLNSSTLAGLKKERQAEIDAEIAANLAAGEEAAAERKKVYDDRIDWYDAVIADHRKQGSKLRAWYADELEAEKQDYINRHNPEWVKERNAKERNSRRYEARYSAFMLGNEDPFPEDGEIPVEWKKALNAKKRRMGAPIPYPEVE